MKIGNKKIKKNTLKHQRNLESDSYALLGSKSSFNKTIVEKETEALKQFLAAESGIEPEEIDIDLPEDNQTKIAVLTTIEDLREKVLNVLNEGLDDAKHKYFVALGASKFLFDQRRADTKKVERIVNVNFQNLTVHPSEEVRSIMLPELTEYEEEKEEPQSKIN